MIEITRDQRDALHGEIRDYCLETSVLGDLHRCLDCAGNGRMAQEMWPRIATAARVLDQIGWDRCAARETYTLTVDEGIADWVRDRLEQTEDCLARFADTLVRARVEREPDLDEGRALADRDLEVIGTYHAILGQLTG